eukprot:COSAG04_NODE_9456_length_862_cov_1.394495_1_plen_167_part_10
MGYSDDEFEDDGASPSPEPPRPRPPQGQSPTKLGVMRSPRSAPKIPVAQARETPCAMRPAPWRLRSANSAVRRGCAGEPHHPNAADGSREDRPDGETGGASPLASARARRVASRLPSAGGVCAQGSYVSWIGTRSTRRSIRSQPTSAASPAAESLRSRAPADQAWAR